MAGFSVGAIVSELTLNKKGWDASVKAVEKDQKTMAGFAKKNGEAMKKMGKAMTLAGAAILAGVGVAVKAFAGFDKSMTESLAIMGNISEALREEMSDAAKQMSTESTFAAKELAEAYFFLASAGLDAEQSIAALPAVTKFAQAGAFDLATATDLLTDAQTALGLSSKDAAENQKNMIALSDILVGANTLANASVRQFSESLTNRAAAALINVNKEMVEGIAVLAAYADKGVKGQVAGQRLTMMINGMTDAQQRNSKEWEAQGIALFDAEGEMRNFADIIEDFENKLGPMTTETKAATLAQLGFNVRTKNSILTLMGSSEAIRENEKRLRSMGGVTEEVAAKQLESLSNKMKVLKNRFNVATIEIGEKLVPAVEKMAAKITEVIKKVTEWMDKHPKLTATIVKVVTALGALMAVLGPLLMILPGIMTAVGAMSASFLAATGIITATVAVFGFTITKIIKLVKVLGQLKKAREAARKAEEKNIKVTGDYEKKLRSLSKAAGVSKKEFDKLLEKYNGNVVALASAIKRGKELVGVQGIMAETVKEASKEIDSETGAVEDLSSALEDDLIPETKEWVEYIKSLGLKTIQEKADRVKKLEDILYDLDDALKKNIISYGVYKKAVKEAKDELNGFSVTVVETAVPAARDMSGAIELAVGEMKGDFQDFGDGVKEVYREVKNYTNELVNSLGNAIGNFVENGLNSMVFFKNEAKKELAELQEEAEKNYDESKKLLNESLEDRLEANKQATEDEKQLLRDSFKDKEEAAKDEYEAKKRALFDQFGESEEYYLALEKLNIHATLENLKREQDLNMELERLQNKSVENEFEIKQQSAEDLQVLNEEMAEKTRELDERKANILKENLKKLWGDIKAGFAQILGDMAKDFAVNFVTKIVTGSGTASKAMKAAGGVFKGVGDKVAGIGEGIGKLISGLAKGIGTAITTLATAIATAATTLAAAAPALLVVGGIALALFAGFSAIKSLFGGGGKKQKKANEYLQDTRNYLAKIHNELISSFKPVLLTDQQASLDDIKKTGWNISELTTEMLGFVEAITDYSQQIAANTAAMVKALGNVPQAAQGGYFPKETLVNVAENNVPEIIAPVPVLQNIIQGGGGGIGGGKKVEVNVRIENSPTFNTLDPMSMRDVWRKFIEPQMLESFSTGGKGKTALKEILGVS